MLEAKRLNLMISPQHLIAYCQANATIAAAVGSVTVRGFAGVPVLAEIKADNIAWPDAAPGRGHYQQRRAGDCRAE